MSILSVWSVVGISKSLVQFIKNRSLIKLCTAMCLKRRCSQKVENVEEIQGLTLLDLPELALENILMRLSPASLCSTAGVCRDLRKRCTSDHLWELHIKAKWDKVVGTAARREWQWTVAMNAEAGISDGAKCKNWRFSWSCLWPFSWLNSKPGVKRKPKSDSQRESFMAWYIALETGSFWFPAQVYNRENGHVGFMLSCYDAELGYERQTDTFNARYPPHGTRAAVIEDGVQWERIRAPPVDTPAHKLHVSDCLDTLRPGDHIEVQWRRNKEFPYGWWYGVVGHLDSCDGYSHRCQCHLDDTAWLEFNQYTAGSRWRRAPINRKCHRESGSEAEGFYGGIRKLLTKAEISTWKQLWPNESLE